MDTRDILIDTTLIIDHLRKKNKRNSQLYNIIDNSRLFVSSVSIYELFAGAINDEKQKDIKDFLVLVEILPFTSEIAERAGEIYRLLRDRNRLIEFRDIFIGATALVHELPIMTLNLDHFQRIEGLSILH